MRKKRILRAVAFLCAFALAPSLIFAQTRTVSGVVSDQNGNPLANATVSIKGEKTAIATDGNGVFKISVTDNAKTLVISYVGATPKEVSIDGRSNVNATIEIADTKLNEVVVIGYGKARKVNLTTAQTTVSSKDIEKTVNTTIEQALQGRAAGVYVTQNSGQPGGGISVNIRGISSINNSTEPLYVVDGVQIQVSQISFGSQSSSNPLAGLNPSDIEDMQILQGPSATAIYGARATNGVILITTKRGKAGEARINYTFQHNVQTPPERVEVMNLRQYAQMVKEYHAIAGGTTPGEFLDPSLLGEGTDWQGELFNNAPMDKHQLSLSGGSNNTTYYLSGEYLKQQGVAQGSGFDRYGFRLNVDNKPRDWMSIGVNLSFNQTNEDLTTSQENIISNALRLTPEVPIKNLDGSWSGGDVTDVTKDYLKYSPVNPLAIASLITNKNARKQFLGGMNLGINITKGLTFRTSFNTNYSNGNSTYYQPDYSIGWAINATPSLSSGTTSSTYWSLNELLEYSTQIGKHGINAMASHEAQESKWKNVSGGRTGFLTNDIFDLNAGDPTTAINNGGSGEWGMESYLGRLTYNYDNRYIVTGSIRRDGSVFFGPDRRWGTFPSASAAWRVTQEKFFNVPFISELKLRLETGVTGNQGQGSGIYAPLATGATTWGTGFLPSRYPNPMLQWEETKTNNIGINIGVFKNRISADFDYYVKDISNLNMVQLLPAYMGTSGVGSVGAPIVNAGTMQSKGWSFSLNTTNIVTKDFKWESNFNLSHYKTVIRKLNSETAILERQSWWLDNWTQRAAIGYEPWLFRGYIAEGIFQSVEEINNSAVPVDNTGTRYPTQERNGIWLGDVKWKDVNNDGKIDVNDVTNIGNPWPKLFGGFTNTFTYKSFDLSILITGTYGNDVYNYLAAVNSNPNNINVGRNLMVRSMDYAKTTTDGSGKVYLTNPGTNVPRIVNGSDLNGNFAKASSQYVEDGSFVRLKNVSLSYNLPASLISKQKIVRSVRATIGAQNLLTITDYSGFDPEVGSYVGRDASSGNQAIGLDFGRYPLTPIYTFTLGVNF